MVIVRNARPNASPNGELKKDLVEWEGKCQGRE